MKSGRRHFVTASAIGAVGMIARSQWIAAVSGALQSSSRKEAPAGEAGSYRQVDSIKWYYELRGRGPTVVLIPSGEGDCGSFEKVAVALSREFAVLTFDMPGFSRSSDPPGFANYSMTQAASEVVALVRALGLAPATFYGCSSGGQVALSLVADHSSTVRNAVVHEVPLPPGTRSDLVKLTDAEIVRTCQDLFRNDLNENTAAWDALGEAFHKRLERNYVTWVRRYVGGSRILRSFTKEELRRRPVTWTIGGLTPAARFFSNVVTAHAAGIEIGLLMCRHFPQVSVPEVLADHIRKAARA
jgi:pimeloyl-ACP methyl ester carboxylesterase